MDWENYQRLLSWMPLVFGLHTAVPLLVAGVQVYAGAHDLPGPGFGVVVGHAKSGAALTRAHADRDRAPRERAEHCSLPPTAALNGSKRRS